MATATKRAARKPKAPESLAWEGEFSKTTPGTVVYKEDGPGVDHVCGSIYIKKGQLDAFGENLPPRVRVTIEFLSE